jgi:hypothetical protein
MTGPPSTGRLYTTNPFDPAWTDLHKAYGFGVSMTNSDGIAGEWSQIVNFLCLR